MRMTHATKRTNVGAEATAELSLVQPGELASPLVESYRRLADVFHEVLSEQSLDTLLVRIADTLAELVPYDSLTIYQADESRRVLEAVHTDDKQWGDKILQTRTMFGEGITGWAIEHREPVLTNSAHLDPRVQVIPGTPPDEPEALISIPLVARGQVKGALNIYRIGEEAAFLEEEFELAKWFGDAAALALDNAQVKARLEHQAQTDSLTGLYNHRFFHERLRAELTRASRSHDHVSVLLMDIDDFKRLNDIHGHGTGDDLLVALSELLRGIVRDSDVVCRVGGEEFAVIMPSCDAGDALGFARRLADLLAATELEPAGRLRLSIGVAQGPEHAMNPRELVACAEVAMMTAKARGKDQIVLFEEQTKRPDGYSARHDVRSIAHLKMLQSLGGKLNRLNDVAAIGETIATELRTLIDYHNCRVYIRDGEELTPIAFRGELATIGETKAELVRVPVGHGVTGHAAATGRSLLIPDGANCEFAVHLEGTEKIDESVIVTPLCYGTRVNGVILISKLGLDQFDDDDVRLLEVLAGHASVALENARLLEEKRQEADEARANAEIASALLEFSRELADAEGIDEVTERIVELAARMLGVERVQVWLPGRVEPVWDTEAHTLAPLTFPDGREGGIAVSEELGDRKLRLLDGIAHQAKLAIANAGNFETLESTFLSTVEALANALEANDSYTSSHARWICDMAVRVGEQLELDAHALKRLELGALFHDIGKIGIPAHILAKPSRLTDEERAVVEGHPELGARILAPIARLADVREIVRNCHERWDGAGYPDGRAGDEIPIEARVIFVCDAYHAMTTNRPYRQALPDAEARRRLREAAGSQFDPRVVDAFLAC